MEPKFHWRSPVWGREHEAICGRVAKRQFVTPDDTVVNCRRCLRAAWDYAHKLYFRLEARRPGGGF